LLLRVEEFHPLYEGARPGYGTTVISCPTDTVKIVDLAVFFSE